MLLVVDDVWNAAHAEWFRVGGVGCRVLVTTREARIEGTEVYPLALMSEGEAIDLVRRKLGSLWNASDEGEVRSFAKVLGYLPLALDLAANQVRDGLSWGELRSEFEVERKAVALEVLDSSEAWERLSEEEQRKYSLRACFNLSLKRLSGSQLQQFAWLGVLPEDVDLSGTIAEVLWAVRSVQAKKGLIDLRSRSFLTDGVQTVEGVATYRVHDLMHDTARGLIENGELGIENLEMAHGAFLERYRGRSGDESWYGLANDGYIHRHLTWHLEMAGRFDEVHELMASGEDQNDWFEACDKIGQPGIFVEDVRRGWRLAEELYETDRGRAIVLQCRYALITGTLNSLMGNLSGELMAAFVKGGFWSIEQAWAYVEQMQDQKIAETIKALAVYLTKPLFSIAMEKARSIRDEYSRADVLSALAQQDSAYLSQLLEEARSIQDEYSRALVLIALAQQDSAYFSEALAAARSIQNQFRRADVLSALAQQDSADLSQLLEAARSIQDESSRAEVLIALAQQDSADFSQLLAAVRVIQDKYSYSKSLIQIAAYYVEPPFEISNELELIGKEHNTYSAFFMSKICCMNPRYIDDAVNLAFKVDSDLDRALILGEIACCYSEFLKIALQYACKLSNNVDRILVLMAIVNDLPANLLTEFIDQISSLIGNDRLRQEILSELTKRKRFLKKTTDQSLGEKFQHIEALFDLISKASALHDLLPRLPLNMLPLKRLQSYLHLLAHRTRANLMGDLATLYPAILHLGGEDAGRGMVGEMGRICKQWK